VSAHPSSSGSRRPVGSRPGVAPAAFVLVAALATSCGSPAPDRPDSDGAPRPAPPTDAVGPTPAPPTAAKPPRDWVGTPDLSGLSPESRDAVLGALAGWGAAEQAGAPPERRAARLLDLAIAYHAFGLVPSAEAAYRRGAGAAPADGRWAYYLGRLYLEAGRPGDARATLSGAIRRLSAYAPAWVALGEACLAGGDPAAARAAFLEAQRRDPSCAAAVDGQGRADAALGRPDEARERFEHALRLDPEATAVRERLARIDGRVAGPSTGTALREPRLRDPWMARVRTVRSGAREHERAGLRFAREGRWAEAADAFAKAVRASDDDPELRYYLGVCEASAGRVDAALTSLRAALELDAGHTRARVTLARLLSARGDDARAVGHYRTAAEARPDDLALAVELGAALLRGGDHDEAAAAFDAVVRRDPTRRDARMGREFSRVAAGRWAEARAGFEDDLKAFPDDARIAVSLARLLAAAPDDDVRDGAAALRIAAPAAERLRGPDTVETLAMALAENGRFEEAVAAQEAALAVAREAGDRERVAWMTRVLDGYRASRPCRTPWRPGEKVFRPAPAPALPELDR